MPGADCRVQIRDLVMGPGTDYEVLGFDPWSRQVRAEQRGPRAFGHGSWSGAEFVEEAVVPIRLRVRNQLAGGPVGWLSAHQRLAAAFAASDQDLELRFGIGGGEYVMFGRPRMVEPAAETVRRGFTVTRAAFAALDPRIYSGVEHVAGPISLPGFNGGLILPDTNLLSNSFFETTITPWTAIGGTVVRSTAWAHEGVASGLLTPDGVTGTVEARSENVAASPGQWCRSRFWVRCAVSRNASANINWRTSGGSLISTTSLAFPLTALTPSVIEVAGVGPATTGQAQAVVSMGSTPAAGHLLHFDEATLSDLTGVTVPFSIGATLSGGSASLTNLGTTETGLRFRIDGPVSTPRLILQRPDGLIQELKLLLTLSAGQFVEVDTAAATVFADGSPAASRRGAASGVFPMLPPGTSTLLFRQASEDAGTVTARWRDAWF